MEFIDIALIGVSILTSLIILVLLRKNFMSDPYEFDLILMGPGVDHHVRISGDSLEFSHKHGEKEYEVKADRLYRVRVGRITGLWFLLRGIKKRFLLGYQYEKTEPISPEGELKVTARVLREVNESKALGKALRGEFKLPMDLKKILLIMGFIVVVIIAYVLVSGGIVV